MSDPGDAGEDAWDVLLAPGFTCEQSVSRLSARV